MKNPIESTKKFVSKHRVGIAIAVTAVVTTAVAFKATRAGVADFQNFLTEKGLFDEYYNSED